MWIELSSDHDVYGLKYYKIEEHNERTKEVRLTNPDPKVPAKGFWVFKVHCFSHAETRRLSLEELRKKKEEASKIGLNKPHKRG